MNTKIQQVISPDSRLLLVRLKKCPFWVHNLQRILTGYDPSIALVLNTSSLFSHRFRIGDGRAEEAVPF